MKRIIILIGTILVVILVIFSYNYIQYQINQKIVKEYNYSFLQFNRKNIYGTDITSVINKAVNSNEQNKISKNELGEYISNQENSIKIYITFDPGETIYPMEKIYQKSMQEFTKLFGGVKFDCTDVAYHKNGKVSEMYFQAINY